jgi:NADPH:quinone reductase-like Zn-dependent oxidoreductase
MKPMTDDPLDVFVFTSWRPLADPPCFFAERTSWAGDIGVPDISSGWKVRGCVRGSPRCQHQRTWVSMSLTITRLGPVKSADRWSIAEQTSNREQRHLEVVMLAVRFDEYGDIDVLKVVEVPKPAPGANQVLVRVVAAGINPGEAAIRKGLMDSVWPATFPSGEGSDFAGVVTEVGQEASRFTVGDAVFGFVNTRASHAEMVVAEVNNLAIRPSNVLWSEAGSLFVAGTTAYAAVQAVKLGRNDTVVVSGAAGGVGSIAVQLAQLAGASVVGVASEQHHPWLVKHGVTPVAHGNGLQDRIRAAAHDRIDAFIDTFGGGYVEMAIGLGVSPDRIDTIHDEAAAAKYNVRTDGNAAAANRGVITELAALVAEGRVEIPIAGRYPLTQVREAYRDLEERHTLGKIILEP